MKILMFIVVVASAVSLNEAVSGVPVKYRKAVLAAGMFLFLLAILVVILLELSKIENS